MRFLFFIVLSFAVPVWAEDCTIGFDAFKSTVYPKIRRDCALCHDGSKKMAPPFAIPDALASYNQLVSYMNFSALDESLLVIRAGNGHCNKVNCQADSGQEMSRLAADWWDRGEKTCERNGRFFSEAVLLPNTLPDKNVGFETIKINLESVKPEFKGIQFQIDVQNYVNKSALTKGQYRFQSPRFVGGKGSIKITDLKILLNGKYDVIHNSYANIDRNFSFFQLKNSNVTATPLLSSESILVLRDSLPNAKVSVSFTAIDLNNEPAACLHIDSFRTVAMASFGSAQCMSCHNASTGSVGSRVFDTSLDPVAFCQRATSLVDPVYPQLSPIILIPSRGLNQHPALSDEQRYEYVRSIKSWLNQ